MLLVRTISSKLCVLGFWVLKCFKWFIADDLDCGVFVLFPFLLPVVTTTKQSVEALRMLRENRNKFDLVISDVNMPDMDGFKLLELVGLEMDLPVISKLLSHYSQHPMSLLHLVVF